MGSKSGPRFLPFVRFRPCHTNLEIIIITNNMKLLQIQAVMLSPFPDVWSCVLSQKYAEMRNEARIEIFEL